MEVDSEPISESVAESVSESVSEPVSESVAEPVLESVAEPVSESVVETVSELMSETVSEHTTSIPVSPAVAVPPSGAEFGLASEPVSEPVSEAASVPVLGYWNIRGLAQPIRLMLAYAEAPFEDKKYAYGPAPDFNRNAWLSEKKKLKLHFPNLPYYIEGNVKVTQSVAIMRHLSRKLKLEAETEEEKIRSDMVEQQVCDIRAVFSRLCYNPDFERLKPEYFRSVPTTMKGLSEFLGKRQWFASKDKLTYIDFMIYETLDHHKHLIPDCIDGHPNLQKFLVRFEALPTIKKYMESPDFMKYPLNGDVAQFGSRRSAKN